MIGLDTKKEEGKKEDEKKNNKRKSEMIAIALLVFLVVTGLVKYFLQVRHFESYVKHVKMGNRSFPLVGNAWSLIGKSTATLFKEITEVTKTHGTPLKGYMGPALVISLDRPEDIKTVLMSPNCLDKPYLYQFYPRPCGILNARCKSQTTIACIEKSGSVN